MKYTYNIIRLCIIHVRALSKFGAFRLDTMHLVDIVRSAHTLPTQRELNVTLSKRKKNVLQYSAE